MGQSLLVSGRRKDPSSQDCQLGTYVQGILTRTPRYVPRDESSLLNVWIASLIVGSSSFFTQRNIICGGFTQNFQYVTAAMNCERQKPSKKEPNIQSVTFLYRYHKPLLGPIAISTRMRTLTNVPKESSVGNDSGSTRTVTNLPSFLILF
jgi:hypothetical protein